MPDSGTNLNTTYGNVNAYTAETVTTGELSAGMKVFWDNALLENTRANLVYAQFGKKHSLPANHGMIMEWRKWKTIPNINRLMEGVIPKGRNFGQTSTTASIAKYGDFVALTEELDMYHVDNVIAGAQQELSYGAARTLNQIHRDGVLAGATNIVMADTIDMTDEKNPAFVRTPLAVYELSDEKANMNPITPDMVAQIKTQMESANVPTINGYYVAVAHPDALHDLMRNSEWNEFHKYAATEEIFNGELGELYGVRFVKSTEAPVMAGDALYDETQRFLTVKNYEKLGAASQIANGYGTGSMYKISVNETLLTGTADYERLLDQYILHEKAGVIENRLTVCGVDLQNNAIYVNEEPDGEIAAGDYLLPGNGGAETSERNEQLAVYATMFFGKDAFGIIDPAGGATQMIVKGKGQIGGPLEQFSTVGVKFETGTKVLYPERVVVLYHTSGKFSRKTTPNWRM